MNLSKSIDQKRLIKPLFSYNGLVDLFLGFIHEPVRIRSSLVLSMAVQVNSYLSSHYFSTTVYSVRIDSSLLSRMTV